MIMSSSLKIRKGDFFNTLASVIASQTFNRYCKSHLSSSGSLPSPAVLTITPISFGAFKASTFNFNFSLSEGSSLLEIPEALGLFGIKTKNLPAKLIIVVKAAPLLPLSSFST